MFFPLPVGKNKQRFPFLLKCFHNRRYSIGSVRIVRIRLYGLHFKERGIQGGWREKASGALAICQTRAVGCRKRRHGLESDTRLLLGWSSKWGPQSNSSISITQEFVRNAGSRATTRPAELGQAHKTSIELWCTPRCESHGLKALSLPTGITWASQ